MGEHLAAELEHLGASSSTSSTDTYEDQCGVSDPRSASPISYSAAMSCPSSLNVVGAGLTGGLVDGLPAEHRRVERLRGVGVGGAQVRPAERPGRVAVALAHSSRSTKAYPYL